MSFFESLFGASNQTPAPAHSPAPQNQQTPAPAPAPTPSPELSPMDEFKSLWEPVATNTEVDGTLPANMFASADPQKMLASARNVDFAKSITPDILTAISKGGPEASAAFAKAINEVSQRSYAQSAFAATKMIEAALTKYDEGVNTRLPAAIRNHSVKDALREDNPALSNPAAAPIIEALQAQFLVKYPNATAAELKIMANKYLTNFAGLLTPKAPAAVVPAAEDWDNFFSKT